MRLWGLLNAAGHCVLRLDPATWSPPEGNQLRLVSPDEADRATPPALALDQLSSLPTEVAGWAARGWLRQEGMYDLVRTKAFALGGELMVARLEADRWIVEHLLGLCGHIGMTPEQAEVVVRAIHAEESKSPS